MDNHPQLVRRCAGAHHHCRPRRCVDSNHLRVIGAPAHTTTSSTPTGKKRVSSCVHITTHITCRCTTKRSTPPPTGTKRVSRYRVSQPTLRAGAQHSGQPPPLERSVCQDACVSQHTLRVGAQHSGRRETRVRRRYTSQIITDGVPTHTTTFVHVGAWIVTLNLFCGVPAHTTTVIHAGA